LVSPYVILLVFLEIILDGYYLSAWLDQGAVLHESLVKHPLEYVSRSKFNASLSVHSLVIHALIGDGPYVGMRVGDSEPSPETFSVSVLVGIHSEIPLVPDNCGAMQFPVGKLSETLEEMLIV